MSATENTGSAKVALLLFTGGVLMTLAFFGATYALEERAAKKRETR